MRGLKAKTLRRLARESGLPAETVYTGKQHRVAMMNPEFGKVPDAPLTLNVYRTQRVLGRCQRRMVQWLKPQVRRSFFNIPVRQFRLMGVKPAGVEMPT